MQGLLDIDEGRRPPQRPGRASRRQWHTGISGDLPNGPGRPTVSQAEGRQCGRELNLRGHMGICPGLLGVLNKDGQMRMEKRPRTAGGAPPTLPIEGHQGDARVGAGGGLPGPPAPAMEGSARREGVIGASPSTRPLTHSWPLERWPVPSSPELPGRLLGSEARAGRAHCTLRSTQRRRQGGRQMAEKVKRQTGEGWWRAEGSTGTRWGN